MKLTRRGLTFLLLGSGAVLFAGPIVARLFAQEQAPNHREFTLTARDYRFSPDRLEVTQDDLVKITVQSLDVAYSWTVDEYRLSKRVPAGGSTSLEFRADRSGSFAFYSNMTNDQRHAGMRGQLVVRPR